MNTATVFDHAAKDGSTSGARSRLGGFLLLSAVLHAGAVQAFLVVYPPPTPQFPENARLEVLTPTTVPQPVLHWVESQGAPAAARMLRAGGSERESVLAYQPGYERTELTLRNGPRARALSPAATFPPAPPPLPSGAPNQTEPERIAARVVPTGRLDPELSRILGMQRIAIPIKARELVGTPPRQIDIVFLPSLAGPLAFERNPGTPPLNRDVVGALARLRPAVPVDGPIIGQTTIQLAGMQRAENPAKETGGEE